MNRIYLLMILFVALASNTFGQISTRTADVAIKHYVSKNAQTTISLMKDGDTVFINDGVSHPHAVKYRFVVNIKNNGPDDLISTDTVRVRGYLFNFRGILAGGGTTPGGIKAGDSVYFDGDYDQPKILLPNTNLTQARVETIQWCDTILAVYQANGDTIKDGPGQAVIDNNSTCNSTVIVAWPTTVKEMEVVPEELVLFPNPATNKLDIRYNFVTAATDVSVVVLNSTGQVVIRQNFSGNYHQTATLPLDVSKLSAGMYFVKLSTGNGDVVSTKFNVTR